MVSKILRGAREMLAHAKGAGKAGRVSVIHVVDIKAIRRRLDMTQRDFAQAFALPLGTVREWEIGRREPDQAAKVLLSVIAAKPKIVREVVANTQKAA